MTATMTTPKKPSRTPEQKEARRLKAAAKKRAKEIIAPPVVPVVEPKDTETLDEYTKRMLPEVVDPKAVEAVDAALDVLKQRPDTELSKAGLGEAVMLSDLADKLGMTVEAVITFPQHLKDAGLPNVFLPAVVRRAHKINRDGIDAMLWRCNWKGDVAPTLSRKEAEEKVVEAEVVIEKKTAKVIAKQEKKDAKVVHVKRTIPSTKGSLYGYTGTAIVRWFGANGVSVDDAKSRIKALGFDLSDSTVKIQHRAGLKGDMSRGELPVMTDEQKTALLSK